MMIFKTYSRRRTLELSRDQPDIYVYDKFADHFRYQICLAVIEGMGTYHVYGASDFHDPPNANSMWDLIDRICRKEIASYAVPSNKMFEQNLAQRYVDYLSNADDVDNFLSALEIGCIGLTATKDDNYQNTLQARNAKMTAAEALDEINGRFEEHSLGYRIENGRVLRLDSYILHQEVVKPALKLLTAPLFEEANEEFMTAHRHYRSKEYKDCITAANRAFECILKAICDAENWTYGKGDRAAELIRTVRSNGLFKHDFEKSFDAYIGLLKAGLPAVRNDVGGHGSSLSSPAVQSETARFALNMTATNVVFIGDCYLRLKQ